MGRLRRQGGKHVRQAAERLVDGLGFPKPLRVVADSRPVQPFAAGEIDKMEDSLCVVTAHQECDVSGMHTHVEWHRGGARD